MSTETFAVELFTQRSAPTLRDIFSIFFRWRWTILTVVLAVIAAVAVSGTWLPTYQAEMKILVRRQRSDAVVTPTQSSLPNSGDQVSEEELNSEVELLNSEELLRKVVLETGLAGTAVRASDAAVSKAVRKLSKNLNIEAVRKTNIIAVRYKAHDPEQGAAVLRALSNTYMAKHTQVHRFPGEFSFFDQQVDQYHVGLDRAQKDLGDFTRNTGVVSAQLQRDAALQRANDFDFTARQTKTSIDEMRRRVEALQQQLKSMDPRMTTVVRHADNSALLESLKSTLLKLKLQRTELATKYDSSYPLVGEVDREIAETTNTIANEESKPVRDETTDQNPTYQLVLTELTKATAELRGLEARASSSAMMASHYNEVARQMDESGIIQQDLLRAARTQEDNYLLYTRKREEARISDALDNRGILNIALAEEPVVPALPAHSPLQIAFLTLLCAGTLGLSSAFLRDFVDPTFRIPDEIARYLNTPVLAALPKSGV
jgi:uncharacterized protein involved in exopolysaccharide biosynthesis